MLKIHLTNFIRRVVISSRVIPGIDFVYRQIYHYSAKKVVKLIEQEPIVIDIFFKGSYARKDFLPGYSDIDYAFVLSNSHTYEEYAHLIKKLAQIRKKTFFSFFPLLGEFEFFTQRDYETSIFQMSYAPLYNWRKVKEDRCEAFPLLEKKDVWDYELFRFSFYIPYYRGYLHTPNVYMRLMSKIALNLDEKIKISSFHEMYYAMIEIFEKRFYEYSEYAKDKLITHSFGPYTPEIEEQYVEFIKIDDSNQLEHYFPYWPKTDKKIVPSPTYLRGKTLKYIEKNWFEKTDLIWDKFIMIHRFQWRSLFNHSYEGDMTYIKSLYKQILNKNAPDSLQKVYSELSDFF